MERKEIIVNILRNRTFPENKKKQSVSQWVFKVDGSTVSLSSVFYNLFLRFLTCMIFITLESKKITRRSSESNV